MLLPLTESDHGWREMPPPRARRLLPEIDRRVEVARLTPERTRLRERPLAFYPGAVLVDVADFGSHPATHRYALIGVPEGEGEGEGEGEIKVEARGRPKRDGDGPAIELLDWTPETIYRANRRLGLALTADTAPDYLRFVLEFIRGPQGRFLLIESGDDLPFSGDEDSGRRDALHRAVRPLALTETTPAGGFRLTGTLLFEGSLIATDFHLDSSGRMEMRESGVLAEDAPMPFDPAHLI